jgi:hypothetical protein
MGFAQFPVPLLSEKKLDKMPSFATLLYGVDAIVVSPAAI